MAQTQRVAWAEGMFLRPQHFQQQTRYLEAQAHQRALSAEPHFWGFRRLEIDQGALAQGKLALLAAEGVLPDGTPFSLPQHAPLPPAISFEEGAVGRLIHLALPLERDGTENVLFEDNPASLARFQVTDALLRDENAFAGEPAEVQLALPRLRLKSQRELDEGWIGLGVARVVECRADRLLVLDRDYIPPVLRIEADAGVMGFLREIEGLVTQRADALAGRLQQPGRGGISEVGEFLLLQLLNRIESSLRHLESSPVLHPERLYSLLVAAAGELCTFVEAGRRPTAEWSPYRHDALRESLFPLLVHLRRALSSVLEQNAIQIDLQLRNYGVRIGQVNDRDLLKSAQFVLAVHAAAPADVLRAHFPTQVKIGPAERIRDLVNLQLPGVGLRLLPVAPRQIPYHAGFHYFEMDTSVDLWKQLQGNGALALHVAGDFPELELQCWAIRRA
jgi:type VI secretion system protein ImpJ